jgi:very-short-patch-repair endonuclease
MEAHNHRSFMNQEGLSKARKNLIKNATLAEIVFKSKLTRWHLRFKFQRIIKGFIVDFYIPQFELVVEIDGSQHYTEWGLLRDQYRDAVLRAEGLTVLHIRNGEVKDFTKEDLLAFVEPPAVEIEDRSFFHKYLESLS